MGIKDFFFKHPPLRLVIVVILFSMALLLVGSSLIYYFNFLNYKIYDLISFGFILLGSFGCFLYPGVIYANNNTGIFAGIVLLTSIGGSTFSMVGLLTTLPDYADTRLENILLNGPYKTVVGYITSIEWERVRGTNYPHPVVTFSSANDQISMKMLNRKCLSGTCRLGEEVSVIYLIEEPRMMKVISRIR